MAFFNIRQWIDRVSQFPNRRTLTNVEDPTDVKTYDLSRAEGEITTQGTASTAATFNDLEGRIASAFTSVEQAMPEANPAQEATASLTKLKVAGTVYEVEGGGGGTTIDKITKAQWDAMTAEERAAFIGVVEDTNADYVPLTADSIPYDSENSIAEKIDEMPTYASQLPLSPTDDTDTASAIGDLSDLDTTEKSSLVGAVNEVVNTNTISVTKGSAVNTATIVCYQVGKLVQFYIVGDANTTWGGSSEIATGLPIPKDTNIRYGIHKTSAGSPYGIGTTYQCAINSNGKLVPMYIPSGAIGNGDYFFISFCYIAKDLQ